MYLVTVIILSSGEKNRFKHIVMEENSFVILTLEGKNKQSIASHLLQVN